MHEPLLEQVDRLALLDGAAVAQTGAVEVVVPHMRPAGDDGCWALELALVVALLVDAVEEWQQTETSCCRRGAEMQCDLLICNVVTK